MIKDTLYKSRGLPHHSPKKGIFRISIAMSDHEKDHFQTIQFNISSLFLRDVVKFTD